jgi:methionyl-tRNA formyltransferase
MEQSITYVGEFGMHSYLEPVKKCLIVAKHDFYLRDSASVLSNKDLEVLTTNSAAGLNDLIAQNPDIAIIFFPHYSEIIPREIFDNFLCIGFHTGNLPRGRGGSPIQHQIIEADYICPISAIQITQSLDSGPIFLQREIDLSDGTIVEILHRASLIIASMIEELSSGVPEPRVQIGTSETRKRLSALDSRLDFEALTERQIYDRIRMLDGLDYPKAYVEFGSLRLSLSSAEWEDTELKFVARIERK